MTQLSILSDVAKAAELAGLEYLIIGGHAVIAYGHLRTTIDIDFLVPAKNLANWKALLDHLGYRSINETSAFAQFEMGDADTMHVDLMLVDDSTWAKLESAGTELNYADRTFKFVSLLHLIALKLHALRTYERAIQGKDYYDILQLIRTNGINHLNPEFQEILNRYATETIKERLIRDLSV